jgi:hypothetical protein
MENIDLVLESINERAKEFIKKYIKQKLGRLSEVEKLKVITEANFYMELMQMGLDKELNKIMKLYDDELNNLIKLSKKLKVKNFLSLKYDSLKLVANIDGVWLLGSAQSYADQLLAVLTKSIIAGDTIEEILSKVENIELLDYQKRVSISQAFTNYRNLLLEQGFRNTEVRFRYAGPLDEKTRPECENALLNQNPEGYTIEELKAGALQDIDFYQLGGFNCRHYWEVVTSEDKKNI